MLNILATPHRKRAVDAADTLFKLAANEAVSDASLASAMAKVPENELRAAQGVIQRRADDAAAAVRARTAELVSDAIVATAQWIDEKTREQPDLELAGEIAGWLQFGGHTRPFWKDADFVAAFGATRRIDLAAAVDELKRRAQAKADAARIPLSWPAGLTERTNA